MTDLSYKAGFRRCIGLKATAGRRLADDLSSALTDYRRGNRRKPEKPKNIDCPLFFLENNPSSLQHLSNQRQSAHFKSRKMCRRAENSEGNI